MRLVHKERRATGDLALAMGIALVVAFLNIAINFGEPLRNAFGEPFTRGLTSAIVNVVFVWLVLLLWVAFSRWRTESRQRMELEDVISSISPDALLVVSPSREIVMCNESIRRIFGYEPREVVGQRTELLYSDRRLDRSYKGEIHDVLEREGFHLGSAVGRHKDGREVPLEIITGELSRRGGAVLLLRDVAERIRIEEERQELESRVRQRQKLESLGVLAGGIAHDFNNLLMGIVGNAELILVGTETDARVRRHAENVRTAARRAAELCQHLLSYSGKGQFVRHPLDLSLVVREMIDLLAVSIAKNVSIRYDLADELPAVDADPAQIRQVVMNFITNASESCEGREGGIAVRTGVQRYASGELRGVLLDEPPPPGEYVFLRVEDTGQGMDDHRLSRIFDPFFTTKATGRGLGLAAVLGIVRGHGGCIKVSSRVGVGSIFTVLLPRSDRIVEQPVENAAAAPRQFRGTVLLVDDEPVVRSAGREMLEYLGFEVVSAVDGNEALKIYEQNRHSIRLVLMDITMPGMNGVEAMHRIRAISSNACVVLSSGYSRDASAVRAGEAGPNSFVQKPYELSTLRDKLAQALGSVAAGGA